jgi:hypothetical protein
MKSNDIKLPIQRRLFELKRARERYMILDAFNTVVQDLIRTDELIEQLPDGQMKATKKAMQEEAWSIVMSEEMCKRILIEE